MRQVTPHDVFPAGNSWVAGVLKLSPGDLSDKFGIVFEQGVGDLGPYKLAALEDRAVGQIWLFRYDSAPYQGTEVLVDEAVLRDDALFAVWSQLGVDVRGFAWVNPYQQFPGGDHETGVAGPPAAGIMELPALSPDLQDEDRYAMEVLARLDRQMQAFLESVRAGMTSLAERH